MGQTMGYSGYYLYAWLITFENQNLGHLKKVEGKNRDNSGQNQEMMSINSI
jgi:hypothetical protein